MCKPCAMVQMNALTRLKYQLNQMHVPPVLDAEELREKGEWLDGPDLLAKIEATKQETINMMKVSGRVVCGEIWSAKMTNKTTSWRAGAAWESGQRPCHTHAQWGPAPFPRVGLLRDPSNPLSSDRHGQAVDDVHNVLWLLWPHDSRQAIQPCVQRYPP